MRKREREREKTEGEKGEGWRSSDAVSRVLFLDPGTSENNLAQRRIKRASPSARTAAVLRVTLLKGTESLSALPYSSSVFGQLYLRALHSSSLPFESEVIETSSFMARAHTHTHTPHHTTPYRTTPCISVSQIKISS